MLRHAERWEYNKITISFLNKENKRKGGSTLDNLKFCFKYSRGRTWGKQRFSIQQRNIRGKKRGRKTMLTLSKRTEIIVVSNLAEKYVVVLRKRNEAFQTMQGE